MELYEYAFFYGDFSMLPTSEDIEKMIEGTDILETISTIKAP